MYMSIHTDRLTKNESTPFFQIFESLILPLDKDEGYTLNTLSISLILSIVKLFLKNPKQSPPLLTFQCLSSYIISNSGKTLVTTKTL